WRYALLPAAVRRTDPIPRGGAAPVVATVRPSVGIRDCLSRLEQQRDQGRAGLANDVSIRRRAHTKRRVTRGARNTGQRAVTARGGRLPYRYAHARRDSCRGPERVRQRRGVPRAYGGIGTVRG